MYVSSCTQIEEIHTDKHQQQIDGFAANVFLVEEEGAEKEAHHHAAAPRHRNDGNHGVGEAEGVEVNEVGSHKKERNEKDARTPPERGGVFASAIPHEQDARHDNHLIIGVPHLYDHAVEPVGQQVFVVERAECAGEGGEHDEINPAVVGEAYALFFTCRREHEKGDYRHDNAYPLVEVEAFAEDEQRAQEGEHGLRRLYRSGYGEGQVLHGEVGEHPRRQHDNGFQHDIEVGRKVGTRQIEQGIFDCLGKKSGEQYGGQEKQAAKERVKEEHGYDGVVVERHFFEHFVHA